MRPSEFDVVVLKCSLDRRVTGGGYSCAPAHQAAARPGLRNGSMTSAPPVAACGVTPGVARQKLDCRRRCRRRRMRRHRRSAGAGGQCGGVGGPVVGTPAPRSRPVQPAHRRLNRRCADARSVARSRGWLDLAHAMTGCGPWSARAAAVLLTLWVLGCSGARRGGPGAGRWCVPGPAPARSRRGSGRLCRSSAHKALRALGLDGEAPDGKPARSRDTSSPGPSSTAAIDSAVPHQNRPCLATYRSVPSSCCTRQRRRSLLRPSFSFTKMPPSQTKPRP